jgi:hypothetical protein
MLLRLRVGVTVLAVALLGAGWIIGDDKKIDDKKTDDKDTPTKVKGVLPAHFKKLGLSDDQTQKIYKIQANYNAKVDALAAQIKDLKTKEKQEVEDVLTDAQKARLKELRSGETKDKDPVKDKDPAKDKGEDKKS